MKDSELPPERVRIRHAETHAPRDKHAQRIERLIDRLPSPRLRRAFRWLRKPSSRWARIIVGVLLIVGGFLSVLPLFGLWMLPLGLILLSEDIPVLRRAVDRILDWIERHRPHWLGASASRPEPQDRRHRETPRRAGNRR